MVISLKEINPFKENFFMKKKINGSGNKSKYYISVITLLLFLAIFEDVKSGNFIKGDKSFQTL